jgi:hypothetical protein
MGVHKDITKVGHLQVQVFFSFNNVIFQHQKQQQKFLLAVQEIL